MKTTNQKPKFSICLIAKNETNKLPKLMGSLKEFINRGGEVFLLDTGSTDHTIEMAEDFGCHIISVEDKFSTKIDKIMANKINKNFVASGEKKVVKAGDKLFDFSSARNYIAGYSKTDMIATPDCDEVYTKFDIDKINEAIDNGAEQLEYNFVFSHDKYGNEAIKFMHSKFYNRKKMKWVGIIHEILQGSAKKVFLGEDIIKLEHWQNKKTNRNGYLSGLALDCYLHPENDRNSHYFAREMLWKGNPKSAINEFKRHIKMNKWIAEKAQSMIYIGDAYGILNKPEEQVTWYYKAFYNDPNRRISLIKLSEFFLHNKTYQACIAMASASLTITYNGFYGNDMRHYTTLPYELLYKAYGWLGMVSEALNAINKCLDYEPLNSIYLRDLRFYMELPTISVIIPTLGREEGLKKCIESINNQNYPQDLIDIKIKDGEKGTVVTKLNEGVKETKGELIVFAANDMEFDKDAFILAVKDRIDTRKVLFAFDTGVRNKDGYINEHFMIFRKYVNDFLGGNIFDPRFHHCGVDELLWKRLDKNNLAMISKGRATHYHFSRIGSGIKQDEVIKKGWAHQVEDKVLLEKIIKEEEL